MYRTTRLFLFSLFIISIVSQREKKKTCIHNLIINGTNLLTSHRKQLLVVGITNFNNQSSRIQANRYEFYLEYQREEFSWCRYNDLYRQLQHHDIRDSIVRIILINEKEGEKKFPGSHYDKVRLFQDNSKDRLIKKLRDNELTTNNYVFGRYDIFSHRYSIPIKLSSFF
jgi:hypothetical protein